MKVTRTVDGKEKTDEYTAKDLDDLKKNNPEAAKIYEQYARRQNGLFQINGGAIQIQARGTWAGNIVNASPAADGVPALMACDASVVLVSKTGSGLARAPTGSM